MQQLIPQNINLVPEHLGVYKIFVKNQANQPIPINRFCQIDNSGLVYIGMTAKQDLKKRLYQFYASAHPEMETHNHSGAQKYCNNQTIRNHLGNGHNLWFEFEVCQTPIHRERELLNQYANIYGEYPPLNK